MSFDNVNYFNAGQVLYHNQYCTSKYRISSYQHDFIEGRVGRPWTQLAVAGANSSTSLVVITVNYFSATLNLLVS